MNSFCNRFYRIAMLFVALAVFIMSFNPCISAFALDNSYLDYQNWENNNDIVSAPFSYSSPFGSTYGDAKYYVDNDSSCVYYCFSVYDDYIESNDDVVIEFDINADNEHINFSVDQNGFADGYADKRFVISTSFNTRSNGNGVYIIAMQIKTGASQNVISTKLHTSAVYFVDCIDNAVLIKPTTTKRSTTKKAKASKVSASIIKKKKLRSATSKTTKYYNKNATMPSTKFETTKEINEFEYIDEVVEYQDYTKQEMTKKNRVIAVVSIIGMAISVLIVVITLIVSKLKPVEDSDDESDDE